MNATLTASSFADELVKGLPTTKTLDVATADTFNADTSSAILASFVGASSYDIGVIVLDESVFAGAGSISVADLIHNAVSSAASSLGDGVVSGARVGDGATLFADPSAVVYELSDGGRGVAAVALRQRESTQLPQGDVSSKLSRISNVNMDLTVTIGRTTMPVRDVLSLEPGAIVELDRSAGAPADILLNGRLIAFGEIVVVDQDYAVRVTKILDTQDAVA